MSYNLLKGKRVIFGALDKSIAWKVAEQHTLRATMI